MTNVPISNLSTQIPTESILKYVNQQTKVVTKKKNKSEEKWKEIKNNFHLRGDRSATDLEALCDTFYTMDNNNNSIKAEQRGKLQVLDSYGCSIIICMTRRGGRLTRKSFEESLHCRPSRRKIKANFAHYSTVCSVAQCE